MQDKVILITGNGSFARAMTARLLMIGVKEIRLFSRNEKAQVETRRYFNDARVTMLIGDIRDYAALDKALRGVDYVFHAAALKHIDICEKQPFEAIKTNVNGSKNVMMAAIKNKVKKVILLSTDKATNAETCYGSTKFLMEKMALALDASETKFIITRYGNILGSSGSVVPLFKKLASEGKPLTITNRSITRFFMPMEDALDLVLSALEYGEDKDIFVFKNKSATVGQIADCISSNQVITGLRCVEKTGEALLTVDELNRAEDFGLYYRVRIGYISSTVHVVPYTSDNAPRYTHNELEDLINNC